jgi:hypothetical protein
MDTAVALVQSYLHVNGYFTVVEYPVVETRRSGPPRTVTDLDVLAFRFPRAHAGMTGEPGYADLAESVQAPDPALGCPVDRADMIVGEVKEGAARFNPAIRDPFALEVGLVRFGCCEPAEAPDLVRRLLATGEAPARAGHSIRMVAFGAVGEALIGARWSTVSLGHVVRFLRAYLHAHWDVLRHAQVRETGLAMLALLEKWNVDGTTDPERKSSVPRQR